MIKGQTLKSLTLFLFEIPGTGGIEKIVQCDERRNFLPDNGLKHRHWFAKLFGKNKFCFL